jgi:hypothetical protein
MSVFGNTKADIVVETGTNPIPIGGVLRVRGRANGGFNQSQYQQGKFRWFGVATGTEQIISLPTDKAGQFTINLEITPSIPVGAPISASFQYTVSPATPGGGTTQPPANTPNPPTAPPTPTSISISAFTGGADSGYGGTGVARAYKINENLTPGLNPGWYVNDERKSTGSQFNYFSSYAKAGDRIYAVLDADKGGPNANQNTGIRSNTIIYNPSGADGAGDQGTPPPGTTGDLDGDGIPDEDDHDIDGDGIPDAEDHDIDGDGVHNDDDDDIDGDGIENHADETPAGTNVNTYDTLYTRASQAQYLGDVFHADPTHTNPAPAKEEKGFSLPTPFLVMAGLAGAFFIYSNSKKR